MIVVSPDDEILILQRAYYMKKYKGLWGFPGGSVDDKDKNSKAGAIRELNEETGIELTWNEEHDCKKFDSIKNGFKIIHFFHLPAVSSTGIHTTLP